jgi:hypothetical protein
MSEGLGYFINLLGLSLLVSYCLVIWFNTNAFVEYFSLLRLGRFFRISEYQDLVKNGYGESFVSFLKEYYHDIFIVRLVSCPICLGFWLTVALLLFFGSVSYIFVAPLSLFFYLIFNKLL